MKISLVLFLSLFLGTAMAQDSYFKAGANLNFSFLGDQSHPGTFASKLYYPTYPGLNLSYERSFGSRFSWVMNLDLNRQTSYYEQTGYSSLPVTSKYVTSSISLSPEIRCYLFHNKISSHAKSQGLFLQFGFKMFEYYSMDYNDYSIQGFSYPLSEAGVGPILPFGTGIKYPLSSKTGLEMNIQTDLAKIGDSWQTVQLGFKFYWLKAGPEKPERSALAPESYFKAGAAMNITFMTGRSNIPWRELYYPSYATINLGYEMKCGRRTSFSLNLESGRKSLYFYYEQGFTSQERHYTVTQFSLIPEFRFYLMKNKNLANARYQGPFLLAGCEVLHYMLWNDEINQGGSFSLHAPGLHGYFERIVPIGFGIKYPVNDKQGMELNFSTNFMEVIGGGYNQTLTLGVKYFWMGKKR